MGENTEIKLTDAQIEKFMKFIDNADTSPDIIPEKYRISLRIFDWLEPILDRMTKLWMYILEGFAVVIVLVLFGYAVYSFRLIAKGGDNIAIGNAILEGVKGVASEMKEMIVALCAGLPAFVGFLRHKGSMAKILMPDVPPKETKDEAN